MVALAAVVALLIQGDKPAYAATATWNVYPGFAVSGISDFGWHFDELGGLSIDPKWGARDYNYAGDANGNVVFSAKLTQNSPYQLRWRFQQYGDCGVKVILQTNFFGWIDVERTEMHYLHLINRVATGTTTAVVQNNNQSVFSYIGQAGSGQGTCGIDPGNEHVHQSADFSPGTRIVGQRKSTDTCWSNTDDFTGTDLYQCPGTFKAHDSVPPPNCPPGAWNTMYWLLSGTVPQYICQEWGQASQSYSATAFKVLGEEEAHEMDCYRLCYGRRNGTGRGRRLLAEYYGSGRAARNRPSDRHA
jgi:hypothetical protein